MLASDLTQRKATTAPKYGIHFMHGFANWLGIKTPMLNNTYSFWSANDLDKREPFAVGEESKGVQPLSNFEKAEILGKTPQ